MKKIRTTKKAAVIIFVLALLTQASFSQVGRPIEKEKSKATVTITIPGALRNDTLVLAYSTVCKQPYNPQDEVSIISVPNSNNEYRFDIFLKGPMAYFKFGKLNSHPNEMSVGNIDPIYSWGDYFVEPGDNIKVLYKKLNGNNGNEPVDLTFIGEGSEKCRLFQLADSLRRILKFDDLISNNAYNVQNKESLFLADFAKTLACHKNEVSPFAQKLLMVDLTYKVRNIELSVLKSSIRLLNKQQKLNLGQSYLDFINKNSIITDTLANVKSQQYSYYQFNLLRFDYSTKNKQRTFDSLFYDIKGRFSGTIKDRMILELFMLHGYEVQNYNQVANDALHEISNKEYADLMIPYKNRMADKMAYDFELPDQNGRLIHLHDFKGKTVIVDFWYTGCGHCLDYFRDVLYPLEEEFALNPNIVFLTINIDRKKDMWLKSIKNGKYTSSRAVNLFTNGLETKHPVITHYKVQAYPQPMLIGKNQKIEMFSDDKLMNKDELRKLIQNRL